MARQPLRILRGSLRARLVGYFLVLSALTVAVVGAIVYLRATDDLTRSVFDRLTAVAEVKADALDRWIDEQRRNVVFVGSVPGFGDDARTLLEDLSAAEASAARERLAATMQVVVEQTSDAQELMILDPEGTVRLSTRPEHEGQSQADEPFFAQGSSRTTVQNAYESSLTGIPTVTVSTPLFDQDGGGRRIGVLAANLDLERIDRIVLEQTGLGESGTTYLVAPDRQFLHARLQAERPEGNLQSAGIDRALAGESGESQYVDYQGAPVMGVFRWLPEHESALLVELSQDEALAPARQLAVVTALVGLFSALLLAIGIWLIARRVTGPILALAATARQVAAGDLSARAAIASDDEVGELAAAFDSMTAQLQENVATLERRVEERTADLTAALAAQQEAEQRYRRLVEELPLAVYMDPPGDPMGASLYVSPPTETMFGYDLDDWKQEGFFGSIIHPEDRGRVTANVDAMDTTEDRASGEYRILTKDGRVVWVRDDANLIRDEHGEPEYVLGFFIDISDQKAAEAELRRQKQYFESLVQVSPVAVVTMDRDERVTAWNPAATILFGFRPEEAIGRLIDELILRTDALRDEGQDVAREAAATGRAQRVGRRMRKDTSLVDVEILMVPLVIDGELVGYYAIYHDITELEAARREADAANQAKSAFLAAMSHEIRTPMNAVIGMSGLLLDTPLDGEQREYAEAISSSGEALLTIINDVLDFSKIEAGRFELESRPFDLERTVRGAVDLIRPVAEAKGIELVHHATGEAPPTLIGDAGRIRQILLNLLSNAVKFTDHGRVELTVRTTPVDDRWDIRVTVQDSGIGISPEGLGRLFQSFSQADASISRRYGGTGLGLAISRRLAELMGGTLTASSTGVPGEGSRFELALVAPRATGAQAEVAVPSPTAKHDADAAGRPLRILLAEDNAMNQKLAIRLLERMGRAADVVANGLEAVEAIARDAYDVVLMDVQMPELDGLEATRRIRSMELAHRPWIIAMTANAMEGDREECLTAGMDGYISKPIRPDDLAAALAAVGSGTASTPA